MSAFTVNQYQALCAAIASGELRVRYDGKEVQYQTMGDLIKAKSLVEADLQASGLLAAPSVGGVQRGGTTYASFQAD